MQFSGYGTQTATWITRLTEAGHDVTVSSYFGLQGAPTQWNGITVLPGFGQAYCTTSLYQHAKLLQPDLVITLGDIWVMDPNLLRQLPLAHWLPVDTRPQSRADRQCIDGSGAQLIAFSQFGFDRMKAAGYDPLYVPHGIDTGIFRLPENRDEIRRTLGLEDSFVIGCNAANNDAIRKALPEIMLAFSRFLSRHPDAVLALHTGVHQDGGQDLECVAENLGITDRVRCVDQYRYACGINTAQDMADWYGMLDVLCATSYGEGFGLPIMEAQSCGIPVITTDASSMTELNPYGIRVSGQPFWNGVHKGWWTAPSIAEIDEAFETTYQNRDSVDRDKLREFALEYDVNTVMDKYMAPALEELAIRLKPS